MRRSLWLAECATWMIAVVTLTWWATTSIANRTAARAEIERFTAAASAFASGFGESASAGGLGSARASSYGETGVPDFQLWSPRKIDAWHRAQATASPLPLGVLRVMRIGVEAAVLEGTDAATLDRAVGHIAGTAVPGTAGNVGIAGHRDSFFRALKHIAAGDAIDLATPAGAIRYHVERTWIVTPDDVWVLDPTSTSALTLVTCYPFHFVGSAPQRFVVRAIRSVADAGAARDH